MIVGLSGGFDTSWQLEYDLPYCFLHDAAAVLLHDGEMVAAVELERLNRIKHTNRSAIPAVRACLEACGATIDDVEGFAFYATEDVINEILYTYQTWAGAGCELIQIRPLLQRLLKEEFGRVIDPACFHFVDHHMCHALGAYLHSGFTDCLTITIDGAGEGNAGLVLRARNGAFEQLRSVPASNSLGYLYRDVIRFLGYEMFEEYKVMGLAPYGDPARFRDFFKTLYELRPEGEFRIHLSRIPTLHSILTPRRRDDPFTTLHKDIAASLQEALEIMALHMIRHYRESTGETRLCLSGGVAHNSTLNGKILLSGIFDEVFVHPASHDAGGALGAALHTHRVLRPDLRPPTLSHLFLGRDIEAGGPVRATIDRWAPLVKVEHVKDVCAAAAQLLADGKVIGWVQGRSEFGPRALGNRSILADPRPAANMARINKMIKKREGYRPFAPSVLEQHAGEYFEMPRHTTALPYMTYVVPVRPDKRALLGGVTHVDGSARVQTVTREQNERYYRLIEAFAERTGVPVLLNTSFNNNAEPIVDTIDDAIACYLTTGLDALVVGDCVVSRAQQDLSAYEGMAVSIPETVAIREVDVCVEKGRRERQVEIFVRGKHGRRRNLSEVMLKALRESNSERTVGQLADAIGIDAAQRGALLDDLRELWANRLVAIGPILKQRKQQCDHVDCEG
jgi:carbamoyltransferase